MYTKGKEINSDPDINEVFESILFSEEHLAEGGYKDGLRKGEKEGLNDGFHLGYHRGAEIGAEIGFYEGVVKALFHINNVKGLSPRIVKEMNTLSSLLQNFPHTNTDHFEDLKNSVRGKYKKLCSLYKFDGSSPDSVHLSF